MAKAGDSESTNGPKAHDTIAERRFRRRLLSQLQLADFMALLMVGATAFSAYATWRTASIANSIYLAAERAYFGIASTKLDDTQPGDPRVTIDYRNLGNVSATDLKILRRILIDHVEIKSSTKVITPGVLSPGPAHFFHLQIPPAAYGSIVAGKTSLEVQVVAIYTNPRRDPLCYMSNMIYDAEEKEFENQHGSLDCATQRGVWPRPGGTQH